MHGGSKLDTGPPPVRGRSDRTGGRFDEIYRTHRADLVAYAARRNADDPELLADMALLDGYRALDRLRSDHPRVLWAYLYRALDSHLKRERSKPAPVPRAELEDLGGSFRFDDDVVGALHFDEALTALSSNQEAALRLRFEENLSAEQVARRLGKSATAVRQLQHQGLRRLRQVFFALVVIVVAGVLVWLVGRDQRFDVSPADGPPAEETGLVTSLPTGSTVGVRLGDPVIAGPDGPVNVTESPDTDTTTPAAGTASTTPSSTTTPTTTTSTTTSTTGGEVDTPPPPQPVRLVAYDGFDLGLADGTTFAGMRGGIGAGGFSSAEWDVEVGSVDATYDATGLRYVDSSGNRLATSPGALRLRSHAHWSTLSRPLAAPPDPGQVYWVSYLVRLDTEIPGDFFWAPSTGLQGLDFGLQHDGHYRFVSGPSSPVPAVQGETVLLVAELRPDGGSLWVDPDLSNRGSPTVTFDAELRGHNPTPSFAVFNYYDAEYTLDEYRVGLSYADVAPRG